MPGFDRTGPMGQGPMTGRGLGNCGAGRGVSQGGAVYGRGRGFGFGQGRGFGFGPAAARGYAPAQPAAQDEASWLRNQADALEAELQGIKARLSELDRDS